MRFGKDNGGRARAAHMLLSLLPAAALGMFYLMTARAAVLWGFWPPTGKQGNEWALFTDPLFLALQSSTRLFYWLSLAAIPLLIVLTKSKRGYSGRARWMLTAAFLAGWCLLHFDPWLLRKWKPCDCAAALPSSVTSSLSARSASPPASG